MEIHLFDKVKQGSFQEFYGVQSDFLIFVLTHLSQSLDQLNENLKDLVEVLVHDLGENFVGNLGETLFVFVDAQNYQIENGSIKFLSVKNRVVGGGGCI